MIIRQATSHTNQPILQPAKPHTIAGTEYESAVTNQKIGLVFHMAMPMPNYQLAMLFFLSFISSSAFAAGSQIYYYPVQHDA